MPEGTIKEGNFKWLLLKIFGIFLVFSLVSALVIYDRLHVLLSPNYGAGISPETLSHEDVLQCSARHASLFSRLIKLFVEAWQD